MFSHPSLGTKGFANKKHGAPPHGGSVAQISISSAIQWAISGPNNDWIAIPSPGLLNINANNSRIYFFTLLNYHFHNLHHTLTDARKYSHLTSECCQSPQSWQCPRVSSSRSGTSRSLLDEGRKSCSPGTGSSGTWPTCPELLIRPVATGGRSRGPADSLRGQNCVWDKTYAGVKQGEIDVDIYAYAYYKICEHRD